MGCAFHRPEEGGLVVSIEIVRPRSLAIFVVVTLKGG
jgi:hypothetical protein